MKKKIFVSLLSVTLLNGMIVPNINVSASANNIHGNDTALVNESMPSDNVVQFEDETIRSGAAMALTSILGHYPEATDFTQENLNKITSFWTPNGSFYPTTLSDLQYMPNIEKIDLRYYIPEETKLDATPVAQLKNLKVFKFNTELQALGGGLASFTPFTNNKKLIEFDYYGEPTNDSSENALNTISNLENLAYTSINNSGIVDIGNLDQLPNLKSIKLNELNTASFPTLAQSKQLDTLEFHGNKLEKFPDLSNFYNMKNIDFEFNSISDLTELNTASSTTESLNLHANHISSLPSMKHFQNLHSLSLLYNDLSEIPDFSDLNSLTNLDLGYNNINTYKNLNKLNELSTPPSVDLSRNILTDNPAEQDYKGDINVNYNFIVGFGQYQQINIQSITNQEIPLNSTKNLPIIFEWEDHHGTDLFLTDYQKDFIDTKNMSISTNNNNVTVNKISSNEISYTANAIGSTEVTLSYGNNIKTTFTVTVE